MATGHGHPLYLHRRGPLHAAPAQCKLVATIGFVFAVVATPREAFWAFAAHAALLAAVAAAARIPFTHVAKRWVIEVPFVAFALLLPFVGGGAHVDVAGVALSVEGLWAAWNILAKATLGVTATIVLASTTDVAELLHGLDRLRLPRPLTAVAGFMVRYGEVVAQELQRMNVARRSRAYDPRWLWQARALAATAGTLFIRSYERGERVHLAMLSRGYTGAMPVLAGHAATGRQWAGALVLPVAAAAVAVAAWLRAWP